MNRLSKLQPPTGTPINMAHPLCQGLEICLPFTDSGGFTIKNYANPNKNGTLTNSSFVNKQLGGCGDFLTSTSSYGRIPVNSPTTALTLSAWVYVTTAPTTFGLFLHSSSFYLAIDTVYRLDNYIQQSGGTTRQATPFATLTANTWYHIAMTYDGANQYVYVNGVLISSLAWSGTIQALTLDMSIGNYYVAPGITYTIKGNVKNVMYYKDRALSATEIRQLYLEPYCIYKQPSLYQFATNIVSTLNTTNFFNFIN